MNISILGHLCIDKNISEKASYISAGSPAMFLSKIFGQLPDCRTTILASYGSDFVHYKSQVEAVFYPQLPTSNKTLVYENVTIDGKRVQKACQRNNALPIPLDERAEQIIQKSDCLFIAPLLPNYPPSYIKQIYSHTHRSVLKILLPHGYYRTFDRNDTVLVREFIELQQVLPCVDVVIFSENDHPKMIEITRSLAQQYRHLLIIVTLGARGARVILQNNYIPLHTTAVSEGDIVDSVGAGDAFAAAFAYRYYQTRDITEAGRFANAIARQRLFFTPEAITIDYVKALAPMFHKTEDQR